VKAARCILKIVAALAVIGAVVGHIRRKKAGRKRTWYRSM
jgi:hypothetical protein